MTIAHNSSAYDVVVVGAGAAGLSAALSAHEDLHTDGRRGTVALLERATRELRGGNTRWSGAFLRLKDETTPVDGLADYGLAVSQGHASRAYYEALTARVPEAFGWLVAKGVQLVDGPTIFLTASATRYQPVGGGEHIVETLFDAVEQTDIAVHYETSAEHLVTAEDGSVVGVRVRTPDGRLQTLGAGAVILAAGGFQGNPEMMARYCGANAYRIPPISRGGRHNRGDGLRMALEAGAGTEGQFDLFHAEPKDPRSQVAEAVVMTFPYGIVVNTQGQRFIDEGADTVDQTYEKVARGIVRQPGSLAYAVFDQQVMSTPGYEHAVLTDVDPVQADTVADLEAELGMPPGSLVATVEAYNAACPQDRDAYDPLALDGLAATPPGQPAKSNWARPIERGPFFAYPQICANVFTFGGVRTDLEARVLTADGYVIPHLYGAGEMTGLYYEMYAGSTSVMRSVTFGRAAGRHAAAQIPAATGGAR
ncbi:FAD-binding protein [Cellulomonas dongxiuzhuiae]|uniref:FAD-binding protein n=1 Tax=Cellulomonas dongxiuzhuiae TaxID=2819979 RepID=UPI001AAEC63B|nr:FAD-binding protein [Cellulomonas dongxiuzhuiae]MBO3087128.1 FAD-binding protein [Cellulomonas dongxiuzhuiae]